MAIFGSEEIWKSRILAILNLFTFDISKEKRLLALSDIIISLKWFSVEYIAIASNMPLIFVRKKNHKCILWLASVAFLAQNSLFSIKRILELNRLKILFFQKSFPKENLSFRQTKWDITVRTKRTKLLTISACGLAKEVWLGVVLMGAHYGAGFKSRRYKEAKNVVDTPHWLTQNSQI